MPSLTDLPELVGFFSYSREDDEDFGDVLSALRLRIQSELRSQLGRSRNSLRLWQDREAIAPGKLWQSEIEGAIDQSAFFIPIISPRMLKSEYCGIEFARCLLREENLGRNDLVFPILFVRVPELENDELWKPDKIMSVVATRQYVNWTEFRYNFNAPEVRREIGHFCEKIADTLRLIINEPAPVTPTLSPSAAPTSSTISSNSIVIPHDSQFEKKYTNNQESSQPKESTLNKKQKYSFGQEWLAGMMGLIIIFNILGIIVLFILYEIGIENYFWILYNYKIILGELILSAILSALLEKNLGGPAGSSQSKAKP
jgi:hypothetical protein